jgi:hypothetical protein
LAKENETEDSEKEYHLLSTKEKTPTSIQNRKDKVKIQLFLEQMV